MASIDERYFGPLEAGEARTAIEQLLAGDDVLPEKALEKRPLAGERERGAMPETRVLLEHAEDPELRTLDGYKGYGGYATLEKAYREMEADEILKELEDSGLRGRGGAGFSMGKKASFLPRGEMAKYLCCNADESEPGAFKDRELMQRNPHQLIEGIAIAAIAADAGHAFIFIRGEYDSQADILDAAVAEAYEAGYLGKDILGTRRDLELVVHRGAGAYICGEETALLDALEGKRGNPRLKPPFPAVQGLYGGPTLINNVETLSNVPRIVAHGAEWFKGYGTEQSPGTKVVSVSGCVRRPGNYEVELGIPTRELIYDLAGGPLEGREVKAFYPGGSSSPVLTAEEGLDLPYSFEAMAEAGSMLGSGSIIVADDTVSIPHMALRTARFYHHESCGKCTPCREGTNWTVKMLERVVRGEATPMDLDIVSSVQENIIGHCLCVLGDSMAMPVSAMVRKFRGEFEAGDGRAPRRAGSPSCRAAETWGPPREPRGDADHRRPRGGRDRGRDAPRRRQARRRRDPGLLLRAEARRPGRRLPHVPGRGRGDPETADLLLDPGPRRDGRPHPHRAGQARAERRGRVPARQPPARLPRLRQRRRMPAAGHHDGLGPGQEPDDRREAPLREADRALAAGRDRPRALHPLLPLRALQPGGRRGRAAAAARARRPHLRRHLRRPPLRRALPRQHHRPLPGRRADQLHLPLPRPALGHRAGAARSARSARASATSASPSATSR